MDAGADSPARVAGPLALTTMDEPSMVDRPILVDGTGVPSVVVDVMTHSATDRSWLPRLITRRVPVADFRDAFARRPDDVKVVPELATGATR